MKKYIVVGVLFLSILLPEGCKKSSSDSTTKPSLDGLTISQAPAYVEAGSTLTFKADVGSLTTSDGTSPVVGIYWQVNSAQKDTLTTDVRKSNPEFVFKADTLGSYAVFCYAFSGTDYYAASASSSFRAIEADVALTGLVPLGEITVKGNTWKARNISHATMGLSFRNSPILDNVMGKLFTWEEATTACPDGWHLPTVAEFEASFADADGKIAAGELMAKASFLDQEMWEYWPQMVISNKYGFNAIPVGYIDTVDPFTTYNKYGEYAMWWTADESAGLGTYLYIYKEYPEVRKGQGDKKTLAMSVRCVKD